MGQPCPVRAKRRAGRVPFANLGFGVSSVFTATVELSDAIVICRLECLANGRTAEIRKIECGCCAAGRL